MLKDQILKELIENGKTAVSGQYLADKYGVSRNAVWKAVNSLKKEGYVISSVTNKGYCLINDNDILSAQSIVMNLNKENKGIDIYIFDSIDSTNNEAKRLIASDSEMGNALIVSNGQKMGRGRSGKDFYSPAGSGVYFSLIYRASEVIKESDIITAKAAVSVIRTVKRLAGEELYVCGVNDIYYKGKKVCGILTEAVSDLETGCTEHIITGIGINVNTEEFPDNISDRAGSLSDLKLDRNELIAGIVNELIMLFGDINNTDCRTEYERYSVTYKNQRTESVF